MGDASAFLDPIYLPGIALAIASAELAAGNIHGALLADNLSAAAVGAFAAPLMAGVDVVHQLIYDFLVTGLQFQALR